MADELADMFDVPEDPMAKQRTITEELLAIIEEFGDYIEKFMFEIVTFLAVVDSSMGLMKDVLALFGFEGWRMAFFPTFSFIVTMSVFLFGSKKRKTKREAEQAGGLGQALEMFEDVMDVMDDVVSVVEDMDEENMTNGGVDIEAEFIGNDEQGEGIPVDSASVDNNKAKIRKVLSVVMLVGGVVAKLRKRRNKDADRLENEGGGSNEQAPVPLSSTNALDSTGSRLTSFGNAAIETGGQVSMLTFDTCASTTTNNNTSVGATLSQASRQVNQVSALAKRENTFTSQNVCTNPAAGNKEPGLAALAETSQQEALGVEKAVGQEASQFRDSLKAGTSNMAGNMAQGTAGLAGSLSAGAAQAAAQGAKKSGGLIPLVVRFVRIVVRVVNRGKGKEEKPNEKAESSKENPSNTEASGNTGPDVKSEAKGHMGSSTSLNYDRESIYYDCESQFTSVEVRRQTLLGHAFSKTSVVSAGTQTEGESTLSLFSPWQSQARLQELENRVLELEAERQRNRIQENMGDFAFSSMTAGGDPEVRVTAQTSWSPERYKKAPRGEHTDSKSGTLERSKSLNEVEGRGSKLQRERQNPSTSVVIEDNSSDEQSMQRRSGRNYIDTPVMVHQEKYRSPYNATGYDKRENISGRKNRRDIGEAVDRVKYESAIDTSSLEDLEGAHSHTERSALSLSSVRFIDEIHHDETAPKHQTTRHRRGGKEPVSKVKHVTDSTKSRGREKDTSYRRPLHDELRRQRLPRNYFPGNDQKWNSEKWSSDICLTGRKQSSSSYFISAGKSTRKTQGRCSSEWNIQHGSGLVRQPNNVTSMTRSPSTLHRSQSSCFGDDESF